MKDKNIKVPNFFNNLDNNIIKKIFENENTTYIINKIKQEFQMDSIKNVGMFMTLIKLWMNTQKSQSERGLLIDIFKNILTSSKKKIIELYKEDEIYYNKYFNNELKKDLKIEFNKKITILIKFFIYYKLFELNIINNIDYDKYKNFNTKDKFVPYPEINNENFGKILNSKKEYQENKIDSFEDKNINDFCNFNSKTGHTLQKQQKFLKNYINPITHYKNLLIFHGTGAGKTCSAITIAENHLNYDNTKKVILLAPGDTIYTNLKKELYNYAKEKEEKKKKLSTGSLQCTGNKYYIPKGNLTDEERDKLIFKNIKKNYDLLKNMEFINKIKDIQTRNKNKSEDKIDNEIKNHFDNRIIIIDECHELRKKHDDANEGETNTKILSTLEKILSICDNIKLILMSATPMYDQPDEIIDIINLFNINQKKKILNANDVFDINDKTLKLKKNGAELLKENTRGIISYYRGYNPISFPLILEPDSELNKGLYKKVETYIPKNNFDYKNVPLKKEEQNKYVKLAKCSLSKFHEKHYLEELKEIETDIAHKTTSDLINIIYPIDKIGNILYGKKGFKNAFRDLYNNTYQYKSFNNGFLTINNLQKYSSKFHNILNNVLLTPGLVFIYFIYKYATKTMGMVLEEAGYLPYKGSPLLNNPVNNKKICSVCNLYNDNIIHKNNNLKKYHKFKQATYIIITGDVTPIERDKLVNITRSEENKLGENIKVIIGSKVMSQSVDFKNVRQIHLGNASHNMSQIIQIIGRGSRFCSDINLDDNNRNVSIFRYSCYINGIRETIDEKLWRTAENKDTVIKQIERILKQNSVDCQSNKNANYFDKQIYKYSNDIDFSSYCDYDVCDYKCFNNNKSVLDKSTYDYIELKDDKKKDVEYFIKNFFIDNNYLSIEYLFKYFSNIEEKIIHSIINKIVGYDNTKYPETIYFKENIGHLVINKGYLVFNEYNNLSNKLNLFNNKLKYEDIIIKLDKIPKKIIKEKNNKDIDTIIYELINLDRTLIDYSIENIYYKSIRDIIEYFILYLDNKKITSILDIPNEYKNLILYFEKNLFKKKFITEEPNDNNYYGYTFQNEYYCLKNNKFKKCEFEQSRALEKNFDDYYIKKLNLEKKEADIVGYMSFNKNKVDFKIIDRLSQKTKKRIDEKVMKTTIYKGKVCQTYEKNNLQTIINYLDIDVSKNKKLNREIICKLIEIQLRKNEYSNKDNLRWFYNLEEWEKKNFVENKDSM